MIGTRWSPRFVNAVLLWCVVLYFVGPIWWLLVSATKSQGDLNSSSGFWFGHLHVGQNAQVLFARDGGIFVRWLANSALYAGFGAAIGTALSVMVGYAFSKYQFRGRETLFNVILAGVLVPPAALALPLFLMLSKAHLTDTYASVLLPSVVSPLGVYLARVAADAAVPDSLLEAAQVDGAGEVRTFFTVSIRLLVPVTVTIFLFQFVAIWNNFLLPLVMLNSRELYPVTLGLYTWVGQFIQDPTLITSVVVGSFVSIVPLIAGFLVLQRFWRTGMAQGAVKG